jgi:quinol-cytochrome oxidoreductase complex cytochrome b subunit
MDNFWSIIWIVVWSFFFVAYLFVLFYVLTDLFRDHELSGWWKALWIIFLIVMPYLTALVYIIADAKALLDNGTISQAEFNQLKAKALA